jgi:outer membrane protein assembly factor BamA
MVAVSGSVRAFADPQSESRGSDPQDSATGACNQPATEQRALITEAETQKFTVRRVEFVGLTYTRDQSIRDRMTPLLNEGDLFSRKKLVKSLQSMSKNKAVYPVRMSDVVLDLNRTERLVDMTICFKERSRR